ncbi:hypothetical protein MPER_06176, partial [Moniliophthora perniciosa FA553]
AAVERLQNEVGDVNREVTHLKNASEADQAWLEKVAEDIERAKSSLATVRGRLGTLESSGQDTEKAHTKTLEEISASLRDRCSEVLWLEQECDSSSRLGDELQSKLRELEVQKDRITRETQEKLTGKLRTQQELQKKVLDLETACVEAGKLLQEVKSNQSELLSNNAEVKAIIDRSSENSRKMSCVLQNSSHSATTAGPRPSVGPTMVNVENLMSPSYDGLLNVQTRNQQTLARKSAKRRPRTAGNAQKFTALDNVCLAT